MKFASVALSALAISLASPALANQHEAQSEMASAYPLTPQGAADWVAMVEKDMFDFSVEYGRVLWINSTYIIHDSDQLAAKYGAQATEKSVKYANEAAKYAQVAGLDPEVARKLDILRNGIVMPAPVRDGAATELNEIATKLGSAYGKGKGTLNGEEINGSDIEAEMGNLRAAIGRGEPLAAVAREQRQRPTTREHYDGVRRDDGCVARARVEDARVLRI